MLIVMSARQWLTQLECGNLHSFWPIVGCLDDPSVAHALCTYKRLSKARTGFHTCAQPGPYGQFPDTSLRIHICTLLNITVSLAVRTSSYDKHTQSDKGCELVVGLQVRPPPPGDGSPPRALPCCRTPHLLHGLPPWLPVSPLLHCHPAY